MPVHAPLLLHAGPTYLPRRPAVLLPTSIHMSGRPPSYRLLCHTETIDVHAVRPEALDAILPLHHPADVSFFWEAPARLAPHVPWEVTANMAVWKTAIRFRSGFPKTGASWAGMILSNVHVGSSARLAACLLLDYSATRGLSGLRECKARGVQSRV
jgi:hypothetical protein